MAKKKSKTGKMLGKMNGTSNLETDFAKILDKMNINYEQHFTFKGKEFDFLLIKYNILIETHGCFYHCSKMHNPTPKYAIQRKNIKNDQHKIKLVKFDKYYTLMVIWEHELKNEKLLIENVNKFIDKHGLIYG
jgi:G:T-mismatch repair DNA endonuclease (very short patch repair protein)